MSETNDNGGPAFPQTPVMADGRVDWPCSYGPDLDGMSLRDYFAARALPMVLNRSFEHGQKLIDNGLTPDQIASEAAKMSYAIADEMLKARKL
jgi:hypothetical protein